jgi:hypothetical protein
MPTQQDATHRIWRNQATVENLIYQRWEDCILWVSELRKKEEVSGMADFAKGVACVQTENPQGGGTFSLRVHHSIR